jgi:hypothetical protein
MEQVGTRLDAALDALAEATAFILEAQKADRRDALAGATPYLKLAGDVIGGLLLTKGLLAAPFLATIAPSTTTSQEALAGFYAETVLAGASAHLASIRVGAAALYDQDLEELAG